MANFEAEKYYKTGEKKNAQRTNGTHFTRVQLGVFWLQNPLFPPDQEQVKTGQVNPNLVADVWEKDLGLPGQVHLSKVPRPLLTYQKNLPIGRT